MAEATQYMFGHQEVVEALLKKQGIHEGLWSISIEFGLAAVNIPLGVDTKVLMPAGMSIVQHIGIKKVDEPNNLTVDAAEVNPAPKGAKKGAKDEEEARKARAKRMKPEF
ncbi:MAG TPA: hypothetical protein VGX24_00235 [Pyrinomonadaceae bacterium]|jgi:hypothetical protein|nr:hypothetical protein [Pyrinomonadaceae bacterium]